MVEEDINYSVIALLMVEEDINYSVIALLEAEPMTNKKKEVKQESA